MSNAEFDNGYWFTAQLKKFADGIGVPGANKLRKDELERAIKAFLRTGKVSSPTKRPLSQSGLRDRERGGLRLTLRIRRYTNDRPTKQFIEAEAQRLAPGLKRRSGARYRLNRWREERLARGIPLTYGDLVREYVRLNQSEVPFARIPHGRYINFVSDFLAAEKGATRREAAKAWAVLKTLDAPKDYRSWVKARGPRRLRSRTSRRSPA